VITRQAELKTRHMPVRELLGRTREVVRLVKPCFMMSPLTVSQFLPADYRFDVVIFDEASQVRPSDAVNSIYRGRALVVAGDEKQLTPTSFFDASVGDEPDEYDEDVPDTFESLLDACKAGAMRVLPLRWHYRSRHEDLIAFSNRSFYKNSMVTFPGARDNGVDVGVAFFKADGRYDRGGRKDNVVEAELVAGRVIHHFDTRAGSSLGVVALSQAQASAIELAVQQARAARPDLDPWFTEDRLDGFFVKNLESVQGDERDVMIMSVGYGPDEHDRLGLNFGPINRDGGWRRLNVAVTRARYRMEVISSFQGGRLGESQNESVQHLKR
jgi:superfamily I DNA and/or RNA helicase